jgi:voltage-gated potassium channel
VATDDADSRSPATGRAIRAFGLVVLLLTVGTWGYVWLGEGRWAAYDALYMTVITLSTVGYGETLSDIDSVPGARIFTMGLILGGTGVMLYLTSVLTAFLVEGDLGGGLRRRMMRRRIEALSGHTVVAGFGRTGQSVVTELRATGHRFIVIEQDAAKLERLAAESGEELLYIVGDATDEDTLREAGLDRATSLVACLTDDRDNLFLVFSARNEHRGLRIVAKVVDPDNERKLVRAGADAVVSPAHIGGTRLVDAVVRPMVTDFIESLMRDRNDPHRIEEFEIPADGALVGLTLGETGLFSDGDALVMAARTPGGALQYTPGPDFPLSAGVHLVVFMRAADCRPFREQLTRGASGRR